MKDFYFSIENSISEVLFKDKNSKFYGFCFPINSEIEVKEVLDNLKKIHPQANHFCYAYNIGIENNLKWRANDDGEPNHSAGTPILGQINSKELNNVLVVVIRYFGGKKLGVSGLINAYKTSAQLTLNEAIIVKKVLKEVFEIHSNYQELNKVMKLIKEHNLEIIKVDNEINCKIVVEVIQSNSEKIENILQNELKLKFLKK